MEINKIFFSFVFACMLLQACTDTIFLVEDKAYMPIEVVGNSNSNILLVIIHGGPGSGSIMYYSKNNNFKVIEEMYQVAYYDQRLAGISQGNAQPQTVSLEILAKDLHKLIILLRQIHHPDKIVLAGHSFGGMLSIKYLSEYGKNDDINGFIDIDGLHNTPLAYSSSIQKVRSNAIEKINAGIDVNFWMDAINYYQSIDTTRLLKFPKHYEYVTESNGVHYEQAIKYVSFDNLFFSEASCLDNLCNSNTSLKVAGDDIIQADLTDLLPSITLPTLVIWGKHDGVVPLSSAYDAYDKIGTNASEKELIIFEKSAHEPFIEESTDFGLAVIEFIESIVNN